MVTRAGFSPIRWFGPPTFTSRESTRRARILWMLEWSFLAIIAVVLVIVGIATPTTLPRRLITVGLVAALVIVLHSLNRHERVGTASWAFVLGLTAIVTERAWHTGGVHSSVALFYVMFVLMAAGLLGLRGSVIAAGACWLGASLLLVAELIGWLVPPAGAEPPIGPYLGVILGLAVTLICLRMQSPWVPDPRRDDLMHMFVHDMRSSLTAVMAHLSLLREEVPDQSESAEYADAAMTATLQVNRMANNLLDIGRLQDSALPLTRTPTDVAQVVRTVVKTMDALRSTRQIEVRARTPVVCRCDAELIRRIVENLVSNAIKHTEERGHITVDVAYEKADVRIAVEDDGHGISEDARARIFERYSAASMLARSGAHSAGLGLAFCTLAAKAHGGRIWVENVAPHGSRFVVTLPEGGARTPQSAI